MSNLETAVTAINEGRKSTAIDLLKQELVSNPKNVPAILLLAQIHEDYQTKEQCFRAILRIEPDHLQAQIGLSALELSPALSTPAQVNTPPPPAPFQATNKISSQESCCPQCGAPRKEIHEFCIQCGFSFSKQASAMADSASIQRPSPAHNENPIRKVDNSDQPPQWAIPNVKNKLPASTESDKAGSQLPLKRKKPTTQQVLKMVVLVLVCYPVGLILGLIMIKISMLLGIFP